MTLPVLLSNTTVASDIGDSPVSMLSDTNTLQGIICFTLRFTGLDTTVQELSIVIRRGGNYYQTLTYSIPAGDTSAEIDMDPIRIGTSQAISITVESDNALDTTVICTAEGIAVEPLQGSTRGRDLAVDASGEVPANNMVSIASLASQASVDTIDGIVDAIKDKTDNLPASPAATGDEMALTTAIIQAIAVEVDSRLLDAGDATDLIASIVARIGNTNVDEASLVVAIKAALFDAGSSANKLSVNASGQVETSNASTHSASDVAELILETPANLLATDGDGKVTTSNPAAGSGSSHTASDVAALILETPAYKLATNASGQVESSNLPTVPAASANAAAVRLELAVELARIDEKISDAKTLTTATMNTLFDDSDASQQLSDFFSGLIDRFDEASDTPVSTISATILAALLAHPDWIELLADAEAARATAVANGLAIGNLPTPLNSTEVQAATASALTAYDPPTRTEATADKDEVLTAIDDIEGGGGSGCSAEDVAELILVDPTKKLLTNSLGQVQASNLSEAGIAVSPSLLMNSSPLEIVQGDTYSGADISWTGELEDQWGNLTGATLTFGLQYGSTNLQKTAVVDSPTAIQSFSVQLTSEETGELPTTLVGRFDVQAQFPSGDIKTLVRGKAIVFRSWTD